MNQTDFGWNLVYFSNNHSAVEAVAMLLEDEMIHTCVLSHDDSRFRIFGEFEVFVREDHRIQAVTIIEQIKSVSIE